MVSPHHTRRIAKAAAYGGGGLLGVGAAAVGVMAAQGERAKRRIGVRRTAAPYADRRYGRSKGPSRRLVMIGDSLAAGLGAESPDATIGAQLAHLVADYGGQAVVLNSVAVVGARSRDLPDQITRALHFRPHVAVIIIGANDVTHAVRSPVSAAFLDEAVRRLRAANVQVVVGTCPDLGTIRPINPPLRWVIRRMSRSLAAAQTVVVAEAGGRAVSLADILGPEFAARPAEMFAADQFHPSPAGYEAVAHVLASSVLAALSRGPEGEVLPTVHDPSVIAPLPEIAAQAAEESGTEVTWADDPARVRPAKRGGRWGRGMKRGQPDRYGVSHDAAPL